MTSLPRSTPAEQHLDPAAVVALLEALEAHDGIEMHSLMVLRHGHVVAEGWWAPYAAEQRPLLYSLSKSFTSTAVAFARDEGLLDLDDPVIRHVPELDAEIVDPRTRSMTLRHLITMASGHDRDMLDDAAAADPADLVRGFLRVPPDQQPGTLFAYSQPCTFTLACVVERNAGMPLTDYLRPRLLDPLGIGPVGWHTIPPGHQMGFSGLHARTEDVAKLGQLYVQGGRWQGRQLLPAGWVEEATRKHVDNAQQGRNPDWRQGYGYQFWIARHGYRGDGAFGQFCVVLPEHDAVVAATAGTEQMQAVLDAMWEHLLPGFDRAPSGQAQTELEHRLASQALEPTGGGAAPEDADTWAGLRAPVSAGDGHPTTVTEVTLDRVGDGWQLTLFEADDQLTVPFSAGSWAVGAPPTARDGREVPVAASGGWHGDALRVGLLLLETPHRMDLEVSPGHATATWRTPPLGNPPLRRLRCPD